MLFKTFLNGFVDFFKSSALLWAMLIFVSLLLALPAQMHEYYRVAAINLGVTGTSYLAISFYVFAATIAIVGFVAVIALHSVDERSSTVRSTGPRRAGEYSAASFAILLPFAGLLIGLLLANVDPLSPTSNPKAMELIELVLNQGVLDRTGRAASGKAYQNLLSFEMASWLHIMAGVAGVLGAVMLAALNVWPAAMLLRKTATGLAHRAGIATIVVGATFGLCSYAVFHWLTELSLALGTFGFLTIGLGLSYALVASLACYSKRVQLPICFAFLAWPILVAIFEWADNDEIPSWNSTPAASKDESDRALAAYLAPGIRSIRARSPVESHDKPIPLYVVAAPGGGLYASYFVSTVLTHATEVVPNFRQHLVAVSAVSGGALGASLYSSLFQDNASCDGYISVEEGSKRASATAELSRVVMLRAFHAHDFLAPVTGALLFLDSIQAYVPTPLPSLDRARALEKSIVDGWKNSKNEANELLSVLMGRRDVPANLRTMKGKVPTGKPFDCPIGNVYRSGAAGPAVLFNVTEVATGRQRVLSPFIVEGAYPPQETKDVSLVTAAMLSARFPYLTPPGWFKVKREKGTARVYLVDGGYYENSGVATAQAVVSALDRLRKGTDGERFAIRLIVLVGPQETAEAQGTYLSELLSPVRALGSARGARGQNYVDAARMLMPQCESSVVASGTDCQLIVGIENLFYPLPLGWDMSELSRLVMEAQDGQFEKCKRYGDSGVVNAACFVDFLKQDLN